MLESNIACTRRIPTEKQVLGRPTTTSRPCHGHRKIRNYTLDPETPHSKRGVGMTVWHASAQTCSHKEFANKGAFPSGSNFRSSWTVPLYKLLWMFVWHNGTNYMCEQIATILECLPLSSVSSRRFDAAVIYMPKSLPFFLAETNCIPISDTNNPAECWNIHGLAMRLPVPPSAAIAWTGVPFAAARLPPAPGQRFPFFYD